MPKFTIHTQKKGKKSDEKEAKERYQKRENKKKGFYERCINDDDDDDIDFDTLHQWLNFDVTWYFLSNKKRSKKKDKFARIIKRSSVYLPNNEKNKKWLCEKTKGWNVRLKKALELYYLRVCTSLNTTDENITTNKGGIGGGGGGFLIPIEENDGIPYSNGVEYSNEHIRNYNNCIEIDKIVEPSYRLTDIERDILFYDVEEVNNGKTGHGPEGSWKFDFEKVNILKK